MQLASNNPPPIRILGARRPTASTALDVHWVRFMTVDKASPQPVRRDSMLLLEMIALGVTTFAAMIAFIALCDWV